MKKHILLHLLLLNLTLTTLNTKPGGFTPYYMTHAIKTPEMIEKTLKGASGIGQSWALMKTAGEVGLVPLIRKELLKISGVAALGGLAAQYIGKQTHYFMQDVTETETNAIKSLSYTDFLEFIKILQTKINGITQQNKDAYTYEQISNFTTKTQLLKPKIRQFLTWVGTDKQEQLKIINNRLTEIQNKLKILEKEKRMLPSDMAHYFKKSVWSASQYAKEKIQKMPYVGSYFGAK